MVQEDLQDMKSESRISRMILEESYLVSMSKSDTSVQIMRNISLV
jgi:hypothetical protein